MIIAVDFDGTCVSHEFPSHDNKQFIVYKINLCPFAISFFNTGTAPISLPTLGNSCDTHVPSKSTAIIIYSN